MTGMARRQERGEGGTGFDDRNSDVSIVFELCTREEGDF